MNTALDRHQPLRDKARDAAIAVTQDVNGHPEWCAQGHHCTAETMPDGEHTSTPEIWKTDLSRVIATRHRRRDGHAHRVELRVILPLDPQEHIAQAQCRHLIAITHYMLRKIFGPNESRPR